jgi:hypothetical protein
MILSILLGIALIAESTNLETSPHKVDGNYWKLYRHFMIFLKIIL